MDVAIIDYGMGNLLSVQRAFEKCGYEAIITQRPDDLYLADRIVLPGVGAFSDAMANLNTYGWIKPLKDSVINDQVPLLGICLGMQLLADISFEGGETHGLGLIPGQVVKLSPSLEAERVPHVGWNDIFVRNHHPVFKGIEDNSNYYFVHSYHFVPKSEKDIGSTTPYCGEFVSAVVHDNIIGTQFHPEKSQKKGFQLLKNFMEM